MGLLPFSKLLKPLVEVDLRLGFGLGFVDFQGVGSLMTPSLGSQEKSYMFYALVRDMSIG